jgi:hypothetical protein
MPGGNTVVGRSRRREGYRGTRNGLAADAAWGSRRDIQGIVNGCLGQAQRDAAWHDAHTQQSYSHRQYAMPKRCADRFGERLLAMLTFPRNANAA